MDGNEVLPKDKVTVIEPSRLYNLSPIGIGTPFVESLSSYLSRLAFAHCVSVGKLLDFELINELTIEWLKNVIQQRIFVSLHYMNSGNHVALDFVNSLNTLTGRDDLINLTLVSWRGIIQKGIVRTKKCWCKLCLNEWSETDEDIYEPLYWYISIVERCPKHNISLSSVCPHCNKTIQIIKTNVILGYCGNCMGWLGTNPTSIEKEKKDVNLNWIKSINGNVGKLLATSSSFTHYPIRSALTNVVSYLIKMFSSGNRTEFAKEFGLDSGTVARWKRGDACIPFSTLLRFSYYFNIDIINLLDIQTKRFYLDDINHDAMDLFIKDKPFDKHNVKKLRSAFEDEITKNKNKPRSLSAVLTSLNVTEYGAYTHARDLCDIITSRYKEYRQKLKHYRINEIEKEIGQIKLEIIQNDGDLSFHSFRKRFGPDRKIYNKEFEEMVDRIIKE